MKYFMGKNVGELACAAIESNAPLSQKGSRMHGPVAIA